MNCKQIRAAMLHWACSGIDARHLGGLEIVEVNEVARLNESGRYAATLYARNIYGTVDHTKKLPALPWRRLANYDPVYFSGFIWAARRADVLQGFNTPLLAALEPRRSLVYFQNSCDRLPFYRLSAVKMRYQRASFAFCSHFLMKTFLERYPSIQRSRCSVIHNAADPREFRPDASLRPWPKTRIGFIGQWSIEKGFDRLVQVIRLLESRRDDFEFALAGSTRFWPGSKLDLSGSLEGLHRVQIVGILEHHRVPQFLRGLDILVVPSVWDEPFGIVNVEGMLCGLPVVAFHVGGIPEIIRHGVDGLLIPRGDVQSMADAIEYLIDNPGVRRHMGWQGRRRAEVQFSWEVHMQRLCEIYDTIVASRMDDR